MFSPEESPPILSQESIDIRRARPLGWIFIGTNFYVYPNDVRLDIPFFIPEWTFDKATDINSGILDYKSAQGEKIAIFNSLPVFNLTNDAKGNPRVQILSTSDTICAGVLPYLDFGPNVLKLEPNFDGPCPNYLISGPPPDKIRSLGYGMPEELFDDFRKIEKEYGLIFNAASIAVAERDGRDYLVIVPRMGVLTTGGREGKRPIHEYKVPEIEDKYEDYLAPLIRYVTKWHDNSYYDYFLDMVMCLASVATLETMKELSISDSDVSILKLFHKHLDKLPYARLPRKFYKKNFDLFTYQADREATPRALDASRTAMLTKIIGNLNLSSDLSEASKYPSLSCSGSGCMTKEKIRNPSPKLSHYGLRNDIKGNYLDSTIERKYKEEHPPFENENYKINGVEFTAREAMIFFATPLEGLLRSLSKDDEIEIHHLTLKDLRLAKAFLNGLILISQYYNDLSEKGFQYLSYNLSLLHWSELSLVREEYEKNFSIGEAFQETVQHMKSLPSAESYGHSDFF